MQLSIGPFKPYSFNHLICAFFYWAFSITLSILLHKKSKKFIYMLSVCLSIFFVIAEIYKLIGRINLYPNDGQYMYFPFCSLFVPALVLSVIPIKFIKKFGLSFLAFGCTIGGFMYMTYPGGGIIDYPIFSIKSIYATFYHFSMLTLGLSILTSKYFVPKLKDIIYYFTFVIIAVIPCLFINKKYNINLLFLTHPQGAPILTDICLWNPCFYKVGCIIFESIIFYLIGFSIYKLINTFIKFLTIKAKH